MSKIMKKMSPSLEDYLEAILISQEGSGVARVKDLANLLKVKASSVIEALGKLKERNLIIHEPYGYIELTREGAEIADRIYSIHKVLKAFLGDVLGIDEETAENDACRIEHYLSKTSIERISKFTAFVNDPTRFKPEWLEELRRFTEEEKNMSNLDDNNGTGDTLEGYISLDRLKPGEKGRIVRINETGALKKKLMGMGFIKDEIVTVRKIAPLGSPVDIEVKSSHISLRKEEAEKIIVERVA